MGEEDFKPEVEYSKNGTNEQCKYKYFYHLCTQKRRWYHAAGVSQARLHDQNIEAGWYPFESLFTKNQQKIK